ncbi:helix-turn-helix domain-containing protein [Methylobacterium sp. NFXW15]|uniref:helix-turn-helix domain-containing protein n=1 Tax=Methylobacterium sp. NFXW15 TaxID=2819512 RepID=UPI003CF85E3A
MDQARNTLLANLSRHAGHARQRLALSVDHTGQLVGIPQSSLEAIERGTYEGTATLDELIQLSLFLGLTSTGMPRAKPPGARN